MPAVRTWCEWKKNPDEQVMTKPIVLRVLGCTRQRVSAAMIGSKTARSPFSKNFRIEFITASGNDDSALFPGPDALADRLIHPVHELVEIGLRGDQ